MLSHGTMSRALVLLAILRKGHAVSLTEFQVLNSKQDKLLATELCQKCNLIHVESNKLVLTEKGETIAKEQESNPGSPRAFRALLKEFICVTRPSWGGRMPLGRVETIVSMTDDEKCCFKEAGLTRVKVDNDVVEWWDDVASQFRSQHEAELLKTGREGERLTILYEQKRVGTFPAWKAFDSNFAGYDILSRQSIQDDASRLIEVKTTRKVSEEFFFVSEREWSTAESTQHYYFYLWKLTRCPELAIVSASDVGPHIAKNCGSGKWTSIAVPFSSFIEWFRPIPF